MKMRDGLRELRAALETIGQAIKHKSIPSPQPRIQRETERKSKPQEKLEWDVRLPPRALEKPARVKTVADPYSDLPQRLRDPAVLRQAIVINEILNKPLALRRRRR